MATQFVLTQDTVILPFSLSLYHDIPAPTTCDDCDPNATCNGGNTCACNAGFQGDGRICEKTTGAVTVKDPLHCWTMETVS